VRQHNGASADPHCCLCFQFLPGPPPPGAAQRSITRSSMATTPSSPPTAWPCTTTPPHPVRLQLPPLHLLRHQLFQRSNNLTTIDAEDDVRYSPMPPNSYYIPQTACESLPSVKRPIIAQSRLLLVHLDFRRTEPLALFRSL
jgi:hypothetical protein